MSSGSKPANYVNGETQGSASNGDGRPTRYGKELPKEWIPLRDEPLRTPTRQLRVVSIGAGVSAMNLAYQIYHEHDFLSKGIVSDLCIYDANEDIGGTWLVNTYPGVACDVPSHIYTFPFEPNPDWSAFYVGGPEILEYFKRTVAKYDLARGVKCGHRVSKAEFNEHSGKWALEIVNTKDDSLITDECDILVSSRGFVSEWKWPKIPGIEDTKMQLCHSAAWDSNIDWTGKRVAVIGNGSSAIQILPQLVGAAAHVTNFIRRATYITPGLGSAEIGGEEQYYYTEEEKRELREDPQALKDYRKKIQAASNRAFDMFIKDSETQDSAREATADMMREKLGHDDELAETLTPTWEVGCRRATPGPGYLESFTRDDVSLVSVGIERMEENGIRTTDGELHFFDTVVCATGFNVSHQPGWPIIGRNSLTLDDAWSDEPVAYLSMCASQFPNFFLFTGPNSPVGHGSLMAALGYCGDYMCQWIRKIVEEDILYVDVKPDVVKEIDAYADEIMQTLVWSGGCHSWYKNHRTDGKVTAVWAGSALSFFEMIERIRPEDFEIVYRSKNRFRFLGNGRSKLEYTKNADLAYYIYK